MRKNQCGKQKKAEFTVPMRGYPGFLTVRMRGLGIFSGNAVDAYGTFLRLRGNTGHAGTQGRRNTQTEWLIRC
jgi:hypothetical protein